MKGTEEMKELSDTSFSSSTSMDTRGPPRSRLPPWREFIRDVWAFAHVHLQTHRQENFSCNWWSLLTCVAYTREKFYHFTHETFRAKTGTGLVDSEAQPPGSFHVSALPVFSSGSKLFIVTKWLPPLLTSLQRNKCSFSWKFVLFKTEQEKLSRNPLSRLFLHVSLARDVQMPLPKPDDGKRNKKTMSGLQRTGGWAGSTPAFWGWDVAQGRWLAWQAHGPGFYLQPCNKSNHKKNSGLCWEEGGRWQSPTLTLWRPRLTDFLQVFKNL